MVLTIDVTADGSTPTGGGRRPRCRGGRGGRGRRRLRHHRSRRPSPPDGWTPYDPTLAPAPAGTEHDVTLHATETEVLEVAPGVTQEMWTFDDQVPGPTLRGKVGDLFTVTLVNKGEVGHSIDFHASKVAWNDEMRTIEPGESPGLPVHRRLRRGVHVPLRHRPDPAPHRQRDVRRDHHRPARAGARSTTSS